MKLDKDLQVKWDELFDKHPMLTFEEYINNVPTRRYKLEREQNELIAEQEERDRYRGRLVPCKHDDGVRVPTAPLDEALIGT